LLVVLVVGVVGVQQVDVLVVLLVDVVGLLDDVVVLLSLWWRDLWLCWSQHLLFFLGITGSASSSSSSPSVLSSVFALLDEDRDGATLLVALAAFTEGFGRAAAVTVGFGF
jgi:hypothetical protein